MRVDISSHAVSSVFDYGAEDSINHLYNIGTTFSHGRWVEVDLRGPKSAVAAAVMYDDDNSGWGGVLSAEVGANW